MNDQDKYEKIEAYLRGDMAGEELRQFEKSLESDNALSSEVELFRNLDEALADEQALKLQKETLKLGETYFNKQETTATPVRRLSVYRRPLAIAASIALILSLGVLFWTLNSGGGSLTNEELYTAYYEPYAFSETVRGGDEPQNAYEEALSAIEQEDYAAAIGLLQTHLTEQPSDMRATFALATSYLETDPPRWSEAAASYQTVIEDGNSLMVNQAKWYLALIYIKQGETGQAKPLLQALQSSADKKLAQQAEGILKELE
jgi:TolA-binding protein